MRSTAAATQSRTMTLAEALDYVHQHRIILHYSDRLPCELWTPQRKLPMSVKRAIHRNASALAILMHIGQCCPTILHRPYWTCTEAGRFLWCEKCIELDHSTY
jgi:hypothetical protein